jgi:hypothetical protein
MSLILDGTNGLSDIDGSASTPAIRGTDTNTGIFFPAADTIAFAEGGAEVARFDSSGQLGLGTTAPRSQLDVYKASTGGTVRISSNTDSAYGELIFSSSNATYSAYGASIASEGTGGVDGGQLIFKTGAGDVRTERMRLDGSGHLLVGTTTENQPGTNNNTVGVSLTQTGRIYASSANPAWFNVTSDGQIVSLRSGGTQEGTISVSGTTVSYNGGHLARWSQLLDGSKDESFLKGTVLSNLDEMCVWEKDGVVAENEQLNRMKVSDVEGDTNVAGVFVNWNTDEDYNSDDMNIAMTGDMIIRIAQGVTVNRGDLLMSAGDGTAKPQGDDIVRSKTIAKVTSTNITCTYADGSYCVPCVLMAC